MKIIIFLFLTLLNLNAYSKVAGFDIKDFKLMELNFVESESNNSTTDWKDREVSFAYQYEPVSEIVKKIMKISGKEVIGLQQLVDIKPAMVLMTKTKALKAVTILLKCAGFKMVESEKYFQIIEDKKINRNACLY